MDAVDTGTAILLSGGRQIDLQAPHPQAVVIDDIARALSRVCRFAGHGARFLSVAEHSLDVLRLARDETDNPAMLRGALLHDAHEAYIGDLTTPLKHLLGARIDDVIRRLDGVIGDALGVPSDLFTCATVQKADLRAYRQERDRLFARGATSERRSVDPERWEQAYLRAWAELQSLGA